MPQGSTSISHRAREKTSMQNTSGFLSFEDMKCAVKSIMIRSIPTVVTGLMKAKSDTKTGKCTRYDNQRSLKGWGERLHVLRAPQMRSLRSVY